MPKGNGMGPMGKGPMTGRGSGYCSGSAVLDAPIDSGLLGGLGCRRGNGGMRGVGYRAKTRFATQPSTNDNDLLVNRLSFLERQLQDLKQNLVKNSTNPE
jgi:hypothetical protein